VFVGDRQFPPFPQFAYALDGATSSRRTCSGVMPDARAASRRFQAPASSPAIRRAWRADPRGFRSGRAFPEAVFGASYDFEVVGVDPPGAGDPGGWRATSSDISIHGHVVHAELVGHFGERHRPVCHIRPFAPWARLTGGRT
jgi:hypothetical protein